MYKQKIEGSFTFNIILDWFLSGVVFADDLGYNIYTMIFWVKISYLLLLLTFPTLFGNNVSPYIIMKFIIILSISFQ